MERTIIDGLLVLIVLIAAYTDVRNGKVFNVLTFPAMAVGLAINGLFYGVDGLLNGISGGIVAFCLLIIFVAVRGVGAGDLKLLMAVGILEGFNFLLLAFVWSGFVIGAVALSILAYRRIAVAALPLAYDLGLGKAIILLDGKPRRLPFAVAIAAGCAIALLTR